MKYQKPLIAIALVSIIVTGCKKTKLTYEPQEVVITGQVVNKHHYDPKSIAIIVNDVATGEQIRFLDDLDGDGTFEVRFERYYPQEVMLKYLSIWNVFTHPGDSIHIELDAKKMESNEYIYHALTFSGDAVKENRQLSMFNAWFAPIRREESKSQKEESRYPPIQYIKYRDSLRKEYHRLAKEFIDNNKISEPINTWIHYEIEHDYFHNLVSYPKVHRALNNYSKSWEVPVTYYDFFEDANFNSEFIVNSHFAKSFISEYSIFYIRNKIEQELIPQGLVKDKILSNGRIAKLWDVENLDSVYVDGITRFSSTDMKQFILNKFFISKQKQLADTETYEKYLTLINKEITEPFLLANLQKNYKENKELEKTSPQNNRKSIVDAKDNSGSEILKKIVSNNQNKVIYIDCWAIWCGPCVAEMPNSRKLMNDLKDQNIEFVFFCCNSPEDAARRKVENLKLGGSHYFLNSDQTNYIQKELSFSSYPNYVLIDKKGNIVKSSSVYSPGSMKTKNKLLELIHEK